MAFEVKGRDLFDGFGLANKDGISLFHLTSSAKNALKIIEIQWNLVNDVLKSQGKEEIGFQTFFETVQEMTDCDNNGGTHMDLVIGFNEVPWTK